MKEGEEGDTEKDGIQIIKRCYGAQEVIFSLTVSNNS
jgi:hypothetical protein